MKSPINKAVCQKLLAQAAPYIAEELGISREVFFDELKGHTTHTYGDGQVVFGFQIPLEEAGCFSAIVRELTVRVQFTEIEMRESEDSPPKSYYFVGASLDYKHQGGGSNGYSFMWLEFNDHFSLAESPRTARKNQEEMDRREKEFEERFGKL